MTARLLRIKMAVAGVLGRRCAQCKRGGRWPWETALWAEWKPGVKMRFLGPHLQVGHPKGRKWSIRAVNQVTRWRRYLDEALRGLVQAECGPCNRKHGGALRYKGRPDKTRQGGKRR